MKAKPTKDGRTLQRTHKTKEEEQIFLVFSIFLETSKQRKTKQKQSKPNKAKSFWIFLLRQTKAKKQRNKPRETTKIFLVFLCF